MENIAAYGPAIIAILVYTLITLLQGAIVGAKKATANMTPGGDPENNYDDALFRINRAHQNAVESLAPITIALLACVLTGVSAWWVNILLALFVVIRVIYIYIYLGNLGKASNGTRTFVYVAGWAVNVILCVMAIASLI